MKKYIISAIILSIITTTIQADYPAPRIFGKTVHFTCKKSQTKSPKNQDEPIFEAFNQAVNETDIVVVDFYADWCGPCKQLGPRIDQLAEDMQNVKFIKVNIDTYPAIASKYHIRSIPQLLFFKGGILQPNATLRGSQTKDAIKKTINNLH